MRQRVTEHVVPTTDTSSPSLYQALLWPSATTRPLGGTYEAAHHYHYNVCELEVDLSASIGTLDP